MVKVALLIGVSEYGPGLTALPMALKNVESMQRVLQHAEMGGFDEVKTLVNPNPPLMRKAIEALCSERTQDDFVVLFFSGYSFLDHKENLSLGTSITRQSPTANIIPITTVAASLINKIISNSHCQQKLLILDYCLHSTLEKIATVRPDQNSYIKTQLGGKRRKILSCATTVPYSLNNIKPELSAYTSYLVEAIETGAADKNLDGWISVKEVHEYACRKLKQAAPALKPNFYNSGEENQILLSKPLVVGSKHNYRQEVELWASLGEISTTARISLMSLAKSEQLSSEDCEAIETEVLRPYREYQKKLQLYEQEFKRGLHNKDPLDSKNYADLRYLQQFLGITDQDIEKIRERVTQQLKSSYQEEDNSNSQMQPLFSSLSEATDSSLPASVSTSLDELAQLDGEEQHQEELLKVSAAPLEKAQTLNSVQIDSTPALEVSSSLITSPTKHASSLPRKPMLGIAFAGGLAVLAWALGFQNRGSVESLQESIETSSYKPSNIISEQQTNTEQGITNKSLENPSVIPIPINPQAVATPEASPLPSKTSTPAKTDEGTNPQVDASSQTTKPLETNSCWIAVNGNIRSQPTSVESNTITSFNRELLVTGKQTQRGWIQVRLPSYKLGWVHPSVILTSKEEMSSCLSKKGIPIRKISD
ncbi:MAG: caspase family protein [Symploca sp. SIO3C6]|nr:caspase family protein [Symploca sp. SIO3C6]